MIDRDIDRVVEQVMADSLRMVVAAFLFGLVLGGALGALGVFLWRG